MHGMRRLSMIGGMAGLASVLLTGCAPAGTNTIASTSASGAAAKVSGWDDLRTAQLRLSADGKKLLIGSNAGNLVSGDTNGGSDYFVKDLVSGTVTRASIGAAGNQLTLGATSGADMSDDGRIVAFTTDDPKAWGGTNPNGQPVVVLRDLTTGINTGLLGTSSYPAANSSSPVLSRDGRWLAFCSTSDLLGSSGAWFPQGAKLYRYDRTTRTLISAPRPIASPSENDWGCTKVSAISNDGSLIQYSYHQAPNERSYEWRSASNTSTLLARAVAAATPTGSYLLAATHLYDRSTRTWTPTPLPVGATSCRSAAISSNARFIVQGCAMKDTYFGQVYRYDRTTSKHVLVSSTNAGGVPNGQNSPSGLQTDGRGGVTTGGTMIAWNSNAEDVIAGKKTQPGQVYLWKKSS